jgi:hypothetical protein
VIDWFHDLSAGPLALLICGTLAAFAWAGILALRPRLRKHRDAEHPDNHLVTAFLSAFGVLFGLVLGLVAVETYSIHDEVEATVAREAAVLGTVYRDLSGYPEPLRTELRAELREYCRFLIETAWPAQRRGVTAKGGSPYINRVSSRLRAYDPGTQAAAIVHQQALLQFDRFLELRRLRLHYVSIRLPTIFWAVVVIGSLLNLAMTWFFASDSLALHLMLAGMLATIIGLMIVLIIAVDWPFRGELAISSRAYEEILHGVMSGPAS